MTARTFAEVLKAQYLPHPGEDVVVTKPRDPNDRSEHVSDSPGITTVAKNSDKQVAWQDFLAAFSTWWNARKMADANNFQNKDQALLEYMNTAEAKKLHAAYVAASDEWHPTELSKASAAVAKASEGSGPRAVVLGTIDRFAEQIQKGRPKLSHAAAVDEVMQSGNGPELYRLYQETGR